MTDHEPVTRVLCSSLDVNARIVSELGELKGVVIVSAMPPARFLDLDDMVMIKEAADLAPTRPPIWKNSRPYLRRKKGR